VGLSYAIITPARNEAENLPRLAGCLREQTLPPAEWVIVDNGSTDDTKAVAERIAAEAPSVRVVDSPGEASPTRGGPVARAFSAGIGRVSACIDVVIKVDADITVEPDYFEQLVREFEDDPSLGIASGICLELVDGSWMARHVTGDRVRGASRAYRRSCLEDVMPLENRPGWDGIDEVRAIARGWRTGSIQSLAFYHHRKVGERDRSRRRQLYETGRANYYGGYRPSYLVLRALYRACREPAALALIAGYAAAAIAREPRCSDPVALAYLRREQSLRHLPTRVREALGR
jgi:biofilm PGA synthesis N-glycosyltransferase PgaC